MYYIQWIQPFVKGLSIKLLYSLCQRTSLKEPLSKGRGDGGPLSLARIALWAIIRPVWNQPAAAAPFFFTGVGMIKRAAVFLWCFTALSALYGQSPAGPLSQLDGAVRDLGLAVSARLNAEKAEKVALGQWSYRNSAAPLGIYWQLQLMEELTNNPDRSFMLVPGPQAGADWTISGEIIQAANMVRIYTRFLRARDSSVTLILHSDFERDQFFNDMLAGGGSSAGFSAGSSADSYEADSWEYPCAVAIGADAESPPVNRTLHDNDEDFFLLTPDRDGALVMETTGNMDTYLEFYRAASRDQIDVDDDGGSGSNARLRYNVVAGERYIVQIRGYGGDTGSYGFRAYIIEQVRLNPDEYEGDDEFGAARNIEIGAVQQHNFHRGGDVDWVKFQVSSPGRYTIRTRGLNSTRLDTYIELFDSDYNAVDEDDDGGEDRDSRLSVQLQAGTYYLKVECLDDEPDQPYTIRVEAE
jgi:hypothetical protein